MYMYVYFYVNVLYMYYIYIIWIIADKLLVLGIIFKCGDANPILCNILEHAAEGLAVGEKVKLNSIDLSKLIPNTHTSDNLPAVNYAGSLTTPPCTENVDW